MRNDDARTVHLRQETFCKATLNSNNFVDYGQKHKMWVLVF